MRVHFFSFFAAATCVCGSFLISPADGQTITHQVTLPAGMTWCDDSMINGLFTQINQFRSEKGAASLRPDTLGNKDAETRAVQFATYMASHLPGTTGFNPHEGYDTTAASLGYNLVSENLAYLTSDPVYIVYGVWQDPLHLAALLSGAANVAGVSCVLASGTPYWTYEPGIGQGTSPTPTPAPPPGGGGGTTALDSEESAFLTLINNYRAQNGAGPLKVSPTLENSSTWMSNDMASKNYVSHTDSLGRDPGSRLAAFGYTYSPWGENIAAGYSDAQSVLSQWMNACDPDASGTCTYAHRKNMLNPSFAAIGIGRAYGAGSSYGWYWTTDFGGY
ncbi:MAG TPA: CAP domain-containing protein, partial [Bryobacteraceae bacterium]|nr:CAP domain-containing protein [Bryobacteraceae bacterium]